MCRRLIRAFMPALALALFVLVGCGRPQVSDVSKGAPHMNDSSAESKRVSVTFINVGKGDCILVRAGTAAVLIDTGYAETAGEVESHLRANGVERLDHLVITHFDRDHVGGLYALGQSFEVGRVWLPNYEGADKQYASVVSAVKGLDLPAQKVEERLELDLGEATLTVYPTKLAYIPNAKGDEGNDNDLSLVATLTHGNDSYLFTGDLEKDGIEAYLQAGLGQFDVLKMPHHGEKSGNTDELIEAVGPQIAIVTDGPDDPADKKTLKLLQKAGVEAYRTSQDGTIVVKGDGMGHYEVETGR